MKKIIGAFSHRKAAEPARLPTVTPLPPVVLQESGEKLLREDGDDILKEE